MKRKIFTLVALLFSVSYAAQAQYSYKPFRIDVGAGLSFPVTSFGIGALGSVEPQYSFGPFGVGLRMEYHVEDHKTEIDNITKFNSALLLTGDYRLSSGTSRPFVGVGLGSYVTAAEFGETDEYSSRYRFFGQKAGAMLRAGIDLPHFRFAIHYHITGSGKLENTSVNFSYLAFTVAVGISGGRID
ncbi:MAG: porin family protein [Prevotellaceae bacterium]|jgi:hypothetical protein|nr:porin family protein [Prevotellaceae bacterium]